MAEMSEGAYQEGMAELPAPDPATDQTLIEEARQELIAKRDELLIDISELNTEIVRSQIISRADAKVHLVRIMDLLKRVVELV